MDAWCSPVDDENQFIQFDMGEKTKVTRIATQGDPASGGKFIRSFAMFYSNDGKKFDVYNEDGSKKEMVWEQLIFLIKGNGMRTIDFLNKRKWYENNWLISNKKEHCKRKLTFFEKNPWRQWYENS